MVEHCRDTHWLGTAGILIGWTLQGYSLVGHCRDTYWLGTAGILIGWALQGYLVVGHCRDTWWLVTKVSFQSGEDNIYFNSNNPTAKVGKKNMRLRPKLLPKLVDLWYLYLRTEDPSSV